MSSPSRRPMRRRTRLPSPPPSRLLQRRPRTPLPSPTAPRRCGSLERLHWSSPGASSHSSSPANPAPVRIRRTTTVHNMTPARQSPESAQAPPSWRWVSGAAFALLAVLVLALIAGGGGTAGPVPGLSDPGALVRWGLPVAKVVFNVAAVLTVGFAVLAVMLPARQEALGREARIALRSTAIAALVWAAAAAAVHVLTLSDLLGVPLPQALAGQSFMTYTQSITQGQAYASVFILALAIVPAARLVIGRGGAIGVLLLAIG